MKCLEGTIFQKIFFHQKIAFDNYIKEFYPDLKIVDIKIYEN